MRRCSLSASRFATCISGIALAFVVGSAAWAGTDTDGVLGYNGSANRGYNGSANRGYNGSANRGYNGSANRGYNGSANRGYNGSANRGYNGSANRGYNGSANRGYNGSANRGYNGSANRGYNGSANRGYNGSANRGYNGSANRGYNGSANRGYNGSANRGYNGSANRGYNGSANRGYNGSANRGYNGSANRGYNGSAARAECTAFGGGYSVAAMGPIESIGAQGASVTVLGQTFETDASGLEVGDYVVAGAHPIFGATVYEVGSSYIPGVSAVKIMAAVTAIDTRVGTASLGATKVDYTASLSTNPALALAVDQPFVAVGTQPVAQGVIVAGPNSGAAVGCAALDGRM
jgi:hypothetical protein